MGEGALLGKLARDAVHRWRSRSAIRWFGFVHRVRDGPFSQEPCRNVSGWWPVSGPPPLVTRRWTGIEPAAAGSPQPAALKAVEPTRRSNTSGGGAYSSGSTSRRRRFAVLGKGGGTDPGESLSVTQGRSLLGGRH